jgi:hypothetical protein
MSASHCLRIARPARTAAESVTTVLGPPALRETPAVENRPTAAAASDQPGCNDDRSPNPKERRVAVHPHPYTRSTPRCVHTRPRGSFRNTGPGDCDCPPGTAHAGLEGYFATPLCTETCGSLDSSCCSRRCFRGSRPSYGLPHARDGPLCSLRRTEHSRPRPAKSGGSAAGRASNRVRPESLPASRGYSGTLARPSEPPSTVGRRLSCATCAGTYGCGR